MSEKNKRNALAELAERLDIRKSKDFIIRIDAHDVSLARRIIAELANAYATYIADMVHNNICLLAYDALANCRAIAEEGDAK